MKTCDHQYEVSSPIDTVEVCIKCGHRRGFDTPTVDPNTQPTHTISIYLSGPIEAAKQVIREHVLAEPLCVTVTPTMFIYTGGEEQGYVVGMVNYPRFPSDPETLNARAEALATLLLEKTFQRSALIVNPLQTKWITR